MDTPSFAENPVGKVARKALDNQLMGSLPTKYRKIFFPSYAAVPYQNNITNVLTDLSSSGIPNEPRNKQTELTDLYRVFCGKQLTADLDCHFFWSEFSVAVLCQSIYWETSNARKSVNISKVNSSVMNQ